jgi:hypothetical protein
MRNQLLFSVAAAMLGACVGGIDMPAGGGGGGGGSGGGSSESARANFDANVAPMLQTECASCHVGQETTTTNMFLGQANTFDSFYAGITNDASINGDFNPSAAHLLTQGKHQGPAWTGDQAQLISSWLTAEASERGSEVGGGSGSAGGGSGSGGTTQNANTTAVGAEQQFAACMSISQTEYTTDQAYMIANMNTEDGRCYSCHEPGGAGGAYWGIANNYLTMWTKWQEQVFITGAFEASAQATNPVTYQMVTAQQKICDKGTELQNNTGTHPTFDCNQTVGGVQPLTTLDKYRQDVQAKEDAGTCPAPAFAPPD